MTERQQVVIDGSQGEGGGQILRISLVISAIAGRPLVVEPRLAWP